MARVMPPIPAPIIAIFIGCEDDMFTIEWIFEQIAITKGET